MRRAAVPTFLFVLSGCSLAFGEGDAGDETFGGGPGGGAPLAPKSDPTVDVAAAEAQADAELDSTCAEGAPSSVTLAPASAGGLGSVEYTRVALDAQRWPDGESLVIDDFRAFFSDKRVVSEPDLAARFTLSSLNEGVVALRFRLPSVEARAPLHVVAVADVSRSAEDLATVRESVLGDLAGAVDTAEGDRLSLVTYGDSPEVLFEAPATEAAATLKALLADAPLPSRDGNNLSAAIERAQSLFDGERGHIVVLTDGGQAMNDDIARSVDNARAAGHLVSAIQFAAPALSDVEPNAGLFYNGALLSSLASRGGGSHMYASGVLAPALGQSAIETRYEALFPIAASDVVVTVTLPSGVTSTLPVPKDGSGVGVSVSSGRGFGVEVPVTGCDAAFSADGAVQSELLVSVVAGGVTLIDRQSVTFVSALAESTAATLDNAIVAVVTALRQRDDKSAKAAFQAVLVHRLAACSEAASDPEACAISQELSELLHGICALVSIDVVTACVEPL